MSKIRILYILNDGNLGGVAGVVDSYLKHIDAEFMVICGSNGKNFDKLLSEGKNVKIVNFVKGSFSIRPILEIIKYIKKFKPDIVHSHHHRACFRGRIASALCRIPHISTLHNTLLDAFFVRKNINIFTKLFYTYRERLTSLFDSYSIALCNTNKNNLAYETKAKIVIIPNGVDTTIFKPTAKKAELIKEFNIDNNISVIGAIGRLSSQKRFDLLLKEFKKILACYSGQVKLLLVGSGEEEQNLKNIVSDLKISANVIFTGHRTDTNDLLSILDIVIFSSSYEGFPLSLLEAMSAQKAIVATDIPVFKELIDSNTGIISSDTTLHKQIIKLLENKALAAKLALNARNKALAHYMIENIIKETRRLYEAAISKKEFIGSYE